MTSIFFGSIVEYPKTCGVCKVQRTLYQSIRSIFDDVCVCSHIRLRIVGVFGWVGKWLERGRFHRVITELGLDLSRASVLEST